MRNRLSKLALLPLLSLFLLAGCADKDKLPGTYDVVGDNGDGTSYKGTVKITKDGDTYVLEWTIAGATHVGVGFIENDRLCSSWATMAGGKLIKGVVVYKIEKDGKLSGRWTQYPGGGKILTETLTPSKGL